MRVQHLPALWLAPRPSILPVLQERLEIVEGGSSFHAYSPAAIFLISALFVFFGSSLQERLKIVKGGIVSNPLTLSQPSSDMLGSCLQDRLKIVKGGLGPDTMLARQVVLNCGAFHG